MRCRACRRWISRGLDAPLAADRAVAVRNHLAGCEACARWRDAVSGAVELLRAEPAHVAPPALVDRSVRAAWSRELASGGEEPLADRLVGVGRFGLAAAGLAAAGLLVLALLRGPQPGAEGAAGRSAPALPALIDLGGDGPDPAAALVAPGRGPALPDDRRRGR